MKHDQSDFGTGLLAHLRRSPHWVADRRELMRVAFVAPALEQPSPRRTTWVALVPLVAGLFAELAG